MTLQEASEYLHMEIAQLELYEENGLLRGKKTKNGIMDYPEIELQRVFHLCSLQKAGMDLASLKRFVNLLEKGASTKEEQIRILRKCRFQLMDEIHGKQQSVDHLDYLIYEIKKQKV